MSLLHLYEMTHSTPNMLNSDFLFVQVQTTGKVPPQRDVRTAIQKHVMRKIGVARRGQPRPQRQLGDIRRCRSHEEQPPRRIIPRNCGDERPTQDARIKVITSTQELACKRSGTKVPRLVSGGCRTDPFMCFPIQMTPETSFLVDYCR